MSRIIVALAAVGFTAVVGQVLLVRELVATLYGNELVLGLILATWLVGGGVGSAWGARRPVSDITVSARLLLVALLLPAQLALVRAGRLLLDAPPGAQLDLLSQVGLIMAAVAPLCVLLGTLFANLAQLLPGLTGGARAYLWESIGAVVGGALFSFVFVRWLDPMQTALIVSALSLTCAAIVRWPNYHKAFLMMSAPLVVVAVLLGGLANLATLRWQWSDLILVRDSPYGRLTVVARSGQTVFFQNGLLSFETQSLFPEQVAHLPLLSHPEPRSVLLIGGGVGGSLREVLLHPVDLVVYVELDPAVIEAARDQLSSQEVAVLDDPRVRILLDDGRRYIRESTEVYDIIVLDLPEPSTGALNRFYTQEFFAEAHRLLAADGILSLGVPSAENYWSLELARRNGSVYWTMREVFDHVLVLPGEHDFLLASDQPLPDGPDLLVQRMIERQLAPLQFTPQYVEYIFGTDRVSGAATELEGVSDVRRNRDRWPICYYYDMVLWFSRFGLEGLFEKAALTGLSLAGLLMVGAAVLGRWRRRLAVPVAVVLIGLVQMALQVVILFSFQVNHGTLYGRVSLVVTAFMLGLAVGASIGQRLAAVARRSLLATAGGMIALTLLVSILPLGVSETVYLFVALIAGGLAGAAFPLAVSVSGGEHRAAVLYAADLMGGCVGALVTAAFAIPLLGLAQTTVILALAGLLALAVLA